MSMESDVRKHKVIAKTIEIPLNEVLRRLSHMMIAELRKGALFEAKENCEELNFQQDENRAWSEHHRRNGYALQRAMLIVDMKMKEEKKK